MARRPQHDDSVSYRDDDTLSGLFGARGAAETRRSRRGRAVLALLVSLALLVGMGWAIVKVINSFRPERLLPEQCVARADDRTVVLSHEQMHYAALVAGVAVREGTGERGALIALTTAMQESSLRNLDGGDLDSVGLFQQRPSQGWGTRSQILDPYYSTVTFLDAMRRIEWQSGDVNDIAQQVQRSAVPDGYRKREPDARVLAAVFTGRVADGLTCLDRQLLPGNPTALVEDLNQTWGVAARPTGGVLELTGATPQIANAWAAFAVANMRNDGVVTVQRGPQTWSAQDKGQGTWTPAPAAPLPDTGVRITFRS